MVEKTVDIIVGVAVFTSVLIFSSAALFNHFSQAKSFSEEERLSFEAEKIKTLLLESSGSPRNWHLSSPSALGLALYDPIRNESLKYALQDLKIEELLNLSYSTLREKLGAEGDVFIKVSFQPENWANSSFDYRIPIYINDSSSNASLELLLPRAHCTSIMLYDSKGRSASSSASVISYYDSSSRYIKRLNLNFSTTGENLYHLYCSPEDIAALPAVSIQNPAQEAETGREERFFIFSTGKIPENRTVRVLKSSAAFISSPRVAYIGNISYEEDILKNRGCRVVEFSSANIGDLFNISYENNLYTFDAVIIGTHAAQDLSINGNLTAGSSEIYSYVLKGGSLGLLGQDSGYGFLSSFYIDASAQGGVNQTLVESYLGILNFPGNLSVTYPSSQDSIYLSQRQSGASSHPSNPLYTFWSWLKPYNSTPYKNIMFASVNNSYITNSSFIIDGYFSTDPSSVWSNSTSSADIINDWTATGDPELIYTAQSYTTTANIDGYANWSQSFYYGERILPEIANLSFAWRIYNYSNALPSKLYIYLRTPSGREYLLWQADYNSTTTWNYESIDISPLLRENGTYRLTLSAWLRTGPGPGVVINRVIWDEVSLKTSYMPVIWMAATLGEGKIVVTGDEPYYSGHQKLLENILYYLLPRERFKGYIARVEIGVSS